MFEIGDRMRLVVAVATPGGEALGTVAGFVTPSFAATVGAPDDVRVRWDSGVSSFCMPRPASSTLRR
jgi:hypothetical protein